VASATGLARRIADMETRLAASPDDSGAKVVLAEALLRQARLTNSGALAARAEQLLRENLRDDPGDYDAGRLLGATLLSLHQFADAVETARHARDARPDDAWNYGVIGDGHLELGRYDEAFEAFQTMMDLRPSAAAYARASYALELQGRIDEALDAMRRSANATSPRDAEGLAWTTVHIGDLLFRLDRLHDAASQYRLANRIFPDHPYALMGLAHLAAAQHRDDEALALAQRVLDRAPSLSVAAFIGDVHARNNRDADAERFYLAAEIIGRESSTNDESLAGFLAERGRRVPEAVAAAEAAAALRQDVRTLDALAWAYFRAGRLIEAREASAKALRTGSREKQFLYHAAAIEATLGNPKKARDLMARALPRGPDFDVLAAQPVAQRVVAPRAVAALQRMQGAS
jgi:tetratricopeptide (TPR) repeat protein